MTSTEARNSKVSTPGRRPILAALLCVLCAGMPLFGSSVVEDSSYWLAIGVTTGLGALGAIVALRFFGFSWQSAPAVYLAFLWMFHFPMTLFIYLIPHLSEQLPRPLYGWTQQPDWYRASIYALLCTVAFAIGAGLASSYSQPETTRATFEDLPKFQVGIVTAAAGLAWLYLQIYREGGLELFGSGYAQMYGTVFGSGFSLAIFFVSVGSCIAFLSAPRGFAWLPLALQFAASMPVLLTGARQFALIGPLVLAVLSAKRGVRLGLIRAGICCVLMLWVISYVGQTRGQGVVEGVPSTGQVSPISALVEMGGSLQTTSLSVDWVRNGDSFLLGGSYWLPFERGLGLLLPLRSDLATDPRAMNMVMVSRISGLGGSAVAESYYNFSVFGVLFFVALGFLLARLDDAARSPISAGVLGVVLYAFVFQARNWFLSVPNLIFLGLIPIMVCVCLDLLARRKAKAPGMGPDRETFLGGSELLLGSGGSRS
jgi:hypothetical protein